MDTRQPTPLSCTLARNFHVPETDERLGAAQAAEIRNKLGPGGLAAVKELILLHQQGYFDAVVVEDGELQFYAADRDFYVAECPPSTHHPSDLV